LAKGNWRGGGLQKGVWKEKEVATGMDLKEEEYFPKFLGQKLAGKEFPESKKTKKEGSN